jgi:hypothetical protein
MAMNPDTLELVVRVLVARGMSEPEARDRASSMSRQRAFQLIWRAEGLCIICKRLRNRSASRCDECLAKRNEQQRTARRLSR